MGRLHAITGGLRALLWCYGYGGDSTDRPDLVAELGLIREALGVSDVRASRTQVTAMLDRVNEDLDIGRPALLLAVLPARSGDR